MRTPILLVLIAATHAAFLFGAYSTGFFGLAKSLPHVVILTIWLGASSALAGFAYFKVGERLRWLSSPVRRIPFAIAAVAVSLFVGVFLSFNTFGT